MDITKVTDVDGEAAMTGPVVFSNRCIISSGDFIRIVFMEQKSPTAPLHYRTGVLISQEVVRSLCDILSHALDPKPNGSEPVSDT